LGADSQEGREKTKVGTWRETGAANKEKKRQKKNKKTEGREKREMGGDENSQRKSTLKRKAPAEWWATGHTAYWKENEGWKGGGRRQLMFLTKTK